MNAEPKRQIVLVLDELDYDAVQKAMARRQNFFGRGPDGGPYPDGDSNLAGTVLAEICRGWMEMLDMRQRLSDGGV